MIKYDGIILADGVKDNVKITEELNVEGENNPEIEIN
jgi:hypothetical protein